MTVRLANVLYWTACALAVAWVGFVYIGISTYPAPDWNMAFWLGAIPAIIVWLIGKALRYVLAGA